MELNIFQDVLRNVSSAMKTPVTIILIIFMCFALYSVGWLIAEAIKERKHLNYSLPELLDKLKASDGDIEQTIMESKILSRQKKALIELTKHPEFNRKMLESLADNLIEKEQDHYDGVLKLTGLVSKLAPMFGLLGTLIPLGPGIIALGSGDTYTLSESMLAAFDTTTAGLLSAGVTLVVHTIRSRWYSQYMSDMETLVDCVVEIVLENRK